MDTNINRVYVNPNFNRVSTEKMYTSDPKYSNMYINPNFARNINSVKQFTNSNRKIYVNPNFINTTNVLNRNEISDSTLEGSLVDYSNSMVNDYSHAIQCKIEIPKKSENIPVHTTSKSRYSLIRRNDSIVTDKQSQVKESCTIRISKYKSVPFDNFKNSIKIVKSDTTTQIFSNSSTNTLISHYDKRNCFKLVRHHSKSTMNTSLKLTPKYNLTKSKRNIDMKFQPKLKSSNLRLYRRPSNVITKKNNMPCRLFTKYGKCLRNLYGSCEYLHDKKHVSICRKFIKGICHDKECLLSHELSSKKMPTCFFYLKGRCIKDDCPYLHVKLSEKSKICQDFLRGYCDKGDTCLHKHIKCQPNKINDKKRYALNKLTCNRTSKLNVSKSFKSKQLKRQTARNIIETKPINVIHNDQVIKYESDCRYFKDLQNKEPTCEVLKPIRCKLGTLPSFIRL